MGAIRCFEQQAAAGPVRPMRIISFENDLLFGTSPVIRRDARRVQAHDSSTEL